MLKRLTIAFLASLLVPVFPAQSQITDNIRVMHYNLLFYGQNNCRSLSDKNTFFRNVFEFYKPDVITANELLPQARFANSIRDNVLNANGRAGYKRANLTNRANANIVNMLYYNSNKVGLAKQVVSNTNLRDINHYKLYHKPDGLDADTDTTFFWIATMHLKAGDDGGDESQRGNMAGPAMGYAQRPSDETAYLMSGDMNLQNSQEEAYQIFTDPARSSWEPFHDPLDKEGFWHNNGRYAATHTQSTREGNLCDGGASGGMDDRFDFILISESLENDQANHVKYVEGSYVTAGQRGNRLNGSITEPNNNAVPQNVAISLKNFSDHLPVMLDLQISTPVKPDTNNTGLAQAESRPLTTWPNPFKDELHIKYSSEKAGQAMLLDAGGRMIRQRNLEAGQSTLRFDTRALAPGFYVLRLVPEGGQPLQKRLIKR